MKKGAVSFLDVLGWKGKWQNHKNEETVAKYRKIINSVRNSTRHVSEGKIKGLSYFRDMTLDIRGISDTLVFSTEGGPVKTLEYHSRFISAVLFRGMELGLPFRGALSYGEFIIDEDDNSTILIGPGLMK